MNKIIRFVSFIVFLISASNLAFTAPKKLEIFKDYLEKGTYDGGGDRSAKSRYYTLNIVFDHFMAVNGKVVVELGTTRSFVHGGLPGCNSDDTRFWTPNSPEQWDWGAGCFTRVAAECLGHLNPEIHTVDIERSHMKRCQVITSDFKDILWYHVCSSEQFLRSWDATRKIDLLYLDTGDMTPIEPTAQMHLREAKIIVERNLIASDGIILIDDIKSTVPKQFGETSDLGKGKYSIPYFLANGFELVASEYQYILRKK